MAWISYDRYLSQLEMENNADIIISYYRSLNIDTNTIAAILGNMQAESTLSPGLNERGGSGYGLVQWTPRSVLENHCSTLGLSPYTSGDVQIQVIIDEVLGTPNSVKEWYSTSSFVNNYVSSGATIDMIGVTGQQFLDNEMGWSADKLALLFMICYERPSNDPSINHYQNRQTYALNWLNYMGDTYTPRLDDRGIRGNFHYYSQNPYYLSGYGMPNCTCYAWGRFWEIGDPNNIGENKPTNLPTTDAGQWFSRVENAGYYQTGQTPRLGAVICFSDNNGGAGHVAIVEEIFSDNSITCSNSAWESTFFYLTSINCVNNRYDYSHYTFQGFIYNPYAYNPPQPIPPQDKKKHYNFILFNRRRRLKLYG